MENNFITVKINEEKLEKMLSFYKGYIFESKEDYVIYEIKSDVFNAKIYKNAKGQMKVVFNGEDAKKEANRWDDNVTLFENDEPTKEIKEDKDIKFEVFEGHIGSDEVGTGDFLLPIIVCAVRATPSEIKYCLDMGIKDSKKLTDKDIKEIIPKILDHVEYSKLTLPNNYCNEQTLKGINLNVLKAKMHNRALLNLKKKHPFTPVYIDQFCEPVVYNNYLKDEKEKIRDLHFATKGEQRFPCVAIASCLARYSLILEQEKLSKELGVEVPFGAGKIVDTWVKKYLKDHSLEDLSKICKITFRNYKDLL